MKIKTLKIVIFGFGSLVMMAGGLVFAAWIAMDRLQSWPNALMEAREVVYGQVILGYGLALVNRKWRKRIVTVAGITTLLFFCGFVGTTASIPTVLTVVTYISAGGTFLAEFVRAAMESKPKAGPFIGSDDPSLN